MKRAQPFFKRISRASHLDANARRSSAQAHVTSTRGATRMRGCILGEGEKEKQNEKKKKKKKKKRNARRLWRGTFVNLLIMGVMCVSFALEGG